MFGLNYCCINLLSLGTLQDLRYSCNRVGVVDLRRPIRQTLDYVGRSCRRRRGPCANTQWRYVKEPRGGPQRDPCLSLHLCGPTRCSVVDLGGAAGHDWRDTWRRNPSCQVQQRLDDVALENSVLLPQVQDSHYLALKSNKKNDATSYVTFFKKRPLSFVSVPRPRNAVPCHLKGSGTDAGMLQ